MEQDKRKNTDQFVKDELINMTQAWDKEISESPTGIEHMTSKTHGILIKH